MKRHWLVLLICIFTFQLNAQKTSSERPKLVIGIVVDQMRYDYLTRFREKYGDNGFKRLITEGYNFKNHHLNYVPTYTGPGHASIFTGTSPMSHGIIGNNWYDKFAGESIYCTGDSNVRPVGTSSDAGKMSPHLMLTTTVADENRLHTQMRGKTIGVSLKDRGSILPAGHTANAAYWFHGQDEGKWITSSFYVDSLPQWVENFNNSSKADSYLKNWNTLYEIETYTESGEDQNNYEGGFKGKETAVFPYDLKKLALLNKGYDLLKTVAYGNDLTTDFALAAIEAEELGQDKFTDFLTLSYSSTDYVGHNFGVNSKEIQDTYLRLDKNIETLLIELDERIGKGNYTIFLTADHAGGDVPAYLKSLGIPAGYFNAKNLKEKLNAFLKEEFKAEDLITNVSNNQIFFDYDGIKERSLDAQEIERSLAHHLLQQDLIAKVFTRTQLSSGSFAKGMAAKIRNGFNQKRSGDVIYVLDPATISYTRTGSTHGSGYPYDTHAPLIFFGNGIKPGSTTQRSEVIDIAPTISALLGIGFPNASIGSPLNNMLDENE